MLYSSATGTGKDLVLLHGWGFNADLFNDLIKTNKEQYRITKIDLPGHGRSDEVAGGIDEWCNEIIKILPSNPILLGWSLGGLLAINIARQVQISKLILIASSPNFIQNDDWKFGIDAANFNQFSNALQLNLSKGLKRFISLQTKDKSQIKQLGSSIDTFPASTTALNQGLEILLNTDLTEQFLALDIDIKVILGRKDTLVPSAVSSWYESQSIDTVILNTGHLPFLNAGFEL
ncbi:alpha/beta fold hydrolase [Candidatus Thioglobus sp.]|nr:alpha/beta fold hydrolase [Candidatus Thioglobus sp.]